MSNTATMMETNATMENSIGTGTETSASTEPNATQSELVEQLANKCGVTLEEAKAALDANNWNMLTATYQLEQEAFKHKQELNNVLSSQSVSDQTAEKSAEQEQTVETIQTVTGSDSAADSQAEANEKTRNTTHKKTEGKDTMKKLSQVIKDLIKQGNRNRFVIHRNGEQLVDMPVTILALLLLGSFGTCAFLMVVGLFLGCRYTINGIGAVEA